MKLRSLPLWLVCDLVCWLGVIFTFPAFAKALHRVAMASTAQGRGIRCSELSLLARLLAEAEAWIAFAIQRRAFSLAGLKPSGVRFAHPTTATTIRALLRRARQLMLTNQAMDARARSTAHRLRRLSAATTTPQQRNTGIAKALTPSEAASPRISRRATHRAAARATTTTTQQQFSNTQSRAGMRVRAPPWRPVVATPDSPFTSAPRRGDRARAPHASLVAFSTGCVLVRRHGQEVQDPCRIS